MPLTVWQLDPVNMSIYYNVAVCDALASAGCSVRYVTSSFLYDADMPVSERFQTDYVYFRGLNNPRLLKYPRVRRVLRAISYPLGHWRILREARRLRPDIVHIQWSRLPRLDSWLVRQLKASGLKVVHTVHDVLPLYAVGSGTEPFRRIYENADALIVHTQANVPDLLRAFPDLEPSHIHVIPHLEIANQDVPPDASKHSAREQLELPADAPIFLFFGNIKHYKGVDVLLDAFDRVSTVRPDSRLIIAGRLDPMDADKLPAPERFNQNPHVHRYDRYIPHSDLWKYYLAADVVVYPYHHIYQSGAMIAGMGFGRPVIATHVGGLSETVDGNGWIVPAGDALSLAETMRESISDMPRLQKMGKRSRQIINEKHAGHVVAEQLLKVYNGIL